MPARTAAAWSRPSSATGPCPGGARGRPRPMACRRGPDPAQVPTLAAILADAEPDVLAYMTFPKEHRSKLHSTDKIDKRFLPGRGIFPTARATSWRSAAHRLKAPPGSLLEPCWIEAPARLLLWRALAPGFDEILVALLGLPGDMRLLVPQFLDIVGIG